MPKGADQVALFGRGNAIAWSHARLHTATAGATEIRGDVRLLDASGAVIAEILGMCLKRVASAARPAKSPATVLADSFLYRMVWRPSDATSDAPSAIKPGRWIIFADRRGVGEGLAKLLETDGNPCYLVGHGGHASPALHSSVDPADADAIVRIVNMLSQPGQPTLRGAVHLWSLDAEKGDATTPASVRVAEDLVSSSALALAQALANAHVPDAPRLVTVTRGAQAVRPDDSVSVVQAPAWGLMKTIAFELPDLQSLCVDLPLDAGAADASFIHRQMLFSGEESQTALRNGQRYVPRVVPYVPRELTSVGVCPVRGAIPLTRPDGTYLVTGGLGGLGLVAGEWLARRGARRIVLVGRSAPSASATRSIARMTDHGADVTVARADVADRAAIEAVIADIERTMPPLRGVIHAAGVVDDGALLDLDRARFERVLAPKTRGAWNLHELTKTAPLDWFVLYSSAVSVLGSPGQGNYAAANAFLDALAHQRRKEDRPALCLNWGPWADVGLAAELKARREKERELRAHFVKMIEADVGIELLELLIRDDNPQTVVLPYDLKNLIQFYPEGGQVAMFGEILSDDLQPLKLGNDSHRLHQRPQLSCEYVAPRTETEVVIAGIWQRALGIEKVGVLDNFFELGGDSVFAAQIIAQINRRFGVNVGLQRAFEALTIEKLADIMDEHLLAKLEHLSDQEAERLLAELPGVST